MLLCSLVLEECFCSDTEHGQILLTLGNGLLPPTNKCSGIFFQLLQSHRLVYAGVHYWVGSFGKTVTRCQFFLIFGALMMTKRGSQRAAVGAFSLQGCSLRRIKESLHFATHLVGDGRNENRQLRPFGGGNATGEVASALWFFEISSSTASHRAPEVSNII